jgi:hypothetical protein
VDELTLRQEGRHVRITTERLNFLFLESEVDVVSATYERFVAQARAHFAARAQSPDEPGVPEELLREILRESTLSWMYFYILNRMPVRITAADWDHPQTRRIIQKVVELTLEPGSVDASVMCARLMGLSADAYREWRADNESFLAMW